jgi:hypothetical protein
MTSVEVAKLEDAIEQLNAISGEKTNFENEGDACEKMLDSAEEKDKSNVELSEIEDEVDTGEESADEDNDDEMKQFFSLMNKAERRNQRKNVQKQNQFNGPKSDWRQPRLGDPDADTTDTEDEDDNQETRKFLGLLQAAKSKNCKPKNNLVNIKWSNGKVQVTNLPSNVTNLPSKVTNLPPNIRITRVAGGEDPKQRREDLVSQRRKELQASRQQREETSSSIIGGKRKFEDRMTLTEAKVADFDDTKDYVDFIQAKLKNVNIKLIK